MRRAILLRIIIRLKNEECPFPVLEVRRQSKR